MLSQVRVSPCSRSQYFLLFQKVAFYTLRARWVSAGGYPVAQALGAFSAQLSPR